MGCSPTLSGTSLRGKRTHRGSNWGLLGVVSQVVVVVVVGTVSAHMATHPEWGKEGGGVCVGRGGTVSTEGVGYGNNRFTVLHLLFCGRSHATVTCWDWLCTLGLSNEPC